MTRAIITAFHLYTPDYGQEYYEPLYNFYISNLTKYRDEFDNLYIVDSNWGINIFDQDYNSKVEIPIEVIRVNPSLRYCNAYKEILPQVKEDVVLFMDDDTVIYRKGVIRSIFDKIGEYDAAGILDSIGNHPSPVLHGKTKFCPYLFCIKKELLMKHRDIDWQDNMPEWESLGLLSIKLAEDNIKVFEFPDDHSNILFNGNQDGEKSKDLGYYHIRSGSVPAWLLACKKEGLPQYKDYLDHQPKTEYLRQMAWYWWMGGDQDKIFEILDDVGVSESEWIMYCIEKFGSYHGLC